MMVDVEDKTKELSYYLKLVSYLRVKGSEAKWTLIDRKGIENISSMVPV